LNNIPPGLNGTMAFPFAIGANQGVYLFGGYGKDSGGLSGHLRGLWRMDVVFVCNGVPSYDPTVCSNRKGTCTAFDVCTCDPGFTGPICQYMECEGKDTSNPAVTLVCNYPNGVCETPPLPPACNCDLGYTGLECTIFDCFGVNSCSGHGT